jgi:hypothetical protein
MCSEYLVVIHFQELYQNVNFEIIPQDVEKLTQKFP